MMIGFLNGKQIQAPGRYSSRILCGGPERLAFNGAKLRSASDSEWADLSSALKDCYARSGRSGFVPVGRLLRTQLRRVRR